LYTVDLELAGRGALVTGASSGIGRGIALALAREGARLAVTARREAALTELADEIEAAGGPRPSTIVADFLSPEAPEQIAAQATAALGAVEILVNNAGGSRPFGKDATEEQWEEALTLNFTRHRQLTGQVLGGMEERGWGRIVNITGKSEPEGVNGAFAAKAALHSWAKGLSREVGGRGITVNSIPPGRIMSEQIERNYSPEYRAQQSAEEIPVGEYGRPEDIAALVCFLASPRGRYITGTVIPVDGGLRRYQF
jgi:3-oxoacyl-[acyl-carrier protein] reductase